MTEQVTQEVAQTAPQPADQDVGQRAPYGEPVTQQPATQQQTEAGQADPGIMDKLGEFLDSVRQGEPKAEESVGAEEESPAERPKGGLNDLTPEDVGDPALGRFVQLLDLHYPQLDRDRAVGKAIEYGDASYIDEAYIREVAGDGADVLIGYFEDAVKIYGESVEQTLAQIHEMAGGKERWESIAGSFTRNAPESIRNVVKSLIDSNNPDEVQQGLEFIMEYASTAGLVDTPAKRVGTSGTSGGGDALSAEQFRAELRKLGGRNRDPKGYDAAVTQLRRRRALGVELGL